jgi:4-hydroxybenzoate polyprenyltransferase
MTSPSTITSDATLAALATEPLYLDADALRSDMFWEHFVDTVRRSPVILLWLPLWFLRGKAFLRSEVERRYAVNPAQPPYRTQALAADDALRPAILLRVLRPQHWLKNTLVFLPFLLSHQVQSPHSWAAALLAFAAFSLAASFGYVVNDILDRHQDRLHPARRFRPIAAGDLPLAQALLLLPPLFLMTGVCCAFLPWQSVIVLAAYLAGTVFYSFVAKERLMADVIVLSLLYTSRLLMGSFATGNIVSEWLAGFSLALFVSLALCKRVAELISLRSRRRDKAPGRNYHTEDIPILEMMAVGSGFLACLIMVLYLQSSEVLKLYRHPEYLWAGVVGLLYWLGRMFIWTHRGKCPDDPLFFAIQDKTTLALLLLAGIFGFLAI